MKNIELFYNLKKPILITGPTGSGKSTLARELHDNSKGAHLNFVTIPLAAMSENLFERELFGCVKGAFTGADRDHGGLLDLVGGGVLFLDEIGELSLNSQKKLLYLLEERKYLPLGSNIEKPFKGRILLATHKKLDEMVRKGEFREDLLFRLRVFNIEMKSLKDDQSLLRKALQKESEKRFFHLSSEATRFLLHYPWPGNYRELLNCMDFLEFFGGKVVQVKSMPEWMTKGLPELKRSSYKFTETYQLELEDFEKNYLNWALQRNRGKINMTASKIGIAKSTLIAKIRKYDINTAKYKYINEYS